MFSVPPFLPFLSPLTSVLCLSFTIYLRIYIFFSRFFFLSGYFFDCTSCVYSCNMHKTTNTKTDDKAAYCKTTNTKTDDKAAYCKIRVWSANHLRFLEIKLPRRHVIGYADSWVLVYCKLGGTVNHGARKYLIEETVPQVFIQAVFNLL